MQQQPPGCGLVSYGTDGSPTYLPLISISAKVYIVDVSARVVLTQLYVNDRNNDKSSSAQYIFPVPATGAVCAFKMQASGGRVVTGVVKERSKVKNEYDIAITNNQWAGLLYEATPDVFVISIGAIPRGQDIEVTIMYVVQLMDGDLPGYDQMEFSLPTYIAARYGTAPAELMGPSSSSKGTHFNVEVEIQMTSEILSVSSPSHSIKVDTRSGKDSKTSMYASTVKLNPNAPVSKLGSDFILAIRASKLGQPRCVAEKRSAEMTVAMSLTFVPRFRLDRLATQEYVFLIDRSGSMAGSQIACAKEALVLFLQSLPNHGTLFNIVSFGSDYSSLWPSSRQYSPSTLDIARRHVDSMSADMGGTEIKAGLEHALQSRDRSIPMSVFLLTDGEVWEHDLIFSLIDREVVKAGNAASGTQLRIFTLGIGNAASTALCEGVARRGNGLCLMTSHNADISQKVARLLLASTVLPLGSMGNIEIDWGYTPSRLGGMAKKAGYDKGKITSVFDEDYDPLGDMDPRFQISLPDPPKIQQVPTRVPDLYPANRFTVFVILSDTTEVPKTVTLRGRLPDGSQMALPPVNVHEASDRALDFPPLIHTLAAHRLILELEDGDTSSQGSFDATDEKLCDAVIEAAVVRFSETYQLASQFASFIAVDEGRNDQQDGGTDSDSNHDPDDDLQDGLDDTPENALQDGQKHYLDDGSEDKDSNHDFDDDMQDGLGGTLDDGLEGEPNHFDNDLDQEGNSDDIYIDDRGLQSRAGAEENDVEDTKSQNVGTDSDGDDNDFLSVVSSTGSAGSMPWSARQSIQHNKWSEPQRTSDYATGGNQSAEVWSLKEDEGLDQPETSADSSCLPREQPPDQPDELPRDEELHEDPGDRTPFDRIETLPSERVHIVEAYAETPARKPPVNSSANLAWDWGTQDILDMPGSWREDDCRLGSVESLLAYETPPAASAQEIRRSGSVQSLLSYGASPSSSPASIGGEAAPSVESLRQTPSSSLAGTREASPWSSRTDFSDAPRSVESLLAYERSNSASPANVIWAPTANQPKKKATATVTWTAGAPIVAAARLQHFDGSFNLDDNLCSLIGKKTSPTRLKSAMPSRIRGVQDSEKIWATVLAAAYMKVHLADDKDVWFGLWQKAADYIRLRLGNEVSFASLVDEASKLL